MIYKMPYPVWEKIADSFPTTDGYIDGDAVELYMKDQCGLVDTGQHFIPPDDEWGSDNELYFYCVADVRKFLMFKLRWC